ncbi:MAG: protein phosphatase [Pararhodobacter sp.]
MAFTIASLSLRAGTLALCPLPATIAERRALAAFAPDLVVSMTESAEMEELGAGDLPRWLKAKRLRWVHFPVADFQAPREGADWSVVSVPAAQLLDWGGTVMLHCRGGLGRSGMVALRLMIESGEDPALALARLRAARPGAVETEPQLAWARS